MPSTPQISKNRKPSLKFQFFFDNVWYLLNLKQQIFRFWSHKITKLDIELKEFQGFQNFSFKLISNLEKKKFLPQVKHLCVYQALAQFPCCGVLNHVYAASFWHDRGTTPWDNLDCSQSSDPMLHNEALPYDYFSKNSERLKKKKTISDTITLWVTHSLEHSKCYLSFETLTIA